MKVFIRIVAAALLVTFSSATYANKTYTPVPSFVFNAKTVFIENKTGDATLQHAVYLEFARWGRLEVVEGREKADVIISISGPNHVREVPASETSSGYPLSLTAPEGDPVPVGMTRISILDPKTGKSVWFSQRKMDLSQSHTGFLDGLRDAMEQQESHKRK